MKNEKFLARTERMIAEKAEYGYFDSCALVVRVGSKKQFVSTPNVDEDTLFDIASMGKVLVTSTLALHAVGEGMMSLDDNIAKYFPYAPADKAGITVRQMLTHTTGMTPNVPFVGPLFEAGTDGIVRQILVSPLHFAPGTSAEYSSSPLVLLGFIAEKVYGMPLEEAFKKVIAGPLGYTRSRFNVTKDVPNLAISNCRREFGDVIIDDNCNRGLGTTSGSGGQFFTAGDITKFCEAILRRDERLYPKNLYDEAEKPSSEMRVTSDNTRRGLGWKLADEATYPINKLFADGAVGHSGWTGTQFFISRKHDLYVIILTNATRFLHKRHGWRWDFDTREEDPMFADIYDSICFDLKEGGLI